MRRMTAASSISAMTCIYRAGRPSVQSSPHPAHRDGGDVALAEAGARSLVVALQRTRSDRKAGSERIGLLDHRSQVLAHRVDVDGDGAGILALERRGEDRPASLQHVGSA